MSDFINKIVTIIMVFAMLVLGPLLLSYKSDTMVSKRLMLNEVSLFLDKTADVRSITEEDVNKLYLACNSYGMSVDVSVKVLMRTAVPTDDEVKVVYNALDSMDDIRNLRLGDIIQVTVKEVGISVLRRLEYSLAKIDDGEFEFTLAKAVV